MNPTLPDLLLCYMGRKPVGVHAVVVLRKTCPQKGVGSLFGQDLVFKEMHSQ